MKIEFQNHGIEIHATGCFGSAGDAIQHVNASGHGCAVLIDSEPLVISQHDAERLATAGVEFAYLGDHQMADGTFRIVTVPVNSD